MNDFTTFSFAHVVTILLFFMIYFAIVFHRKKLTSYQGYIKWTLLSSLIICEVSYQSWLILTKQWEVSDLPLQLCSISTYITLFLFLKNNQRMFNLLYFIGTLPPILGMVTPELEHQFPHFHFLEYFLHHAAIPLSVLYFILFENYRVPKKAIINSFIILNILAVPIFFLNLLLDTNFFYIASPTERETLLSFFGSGIWYYINLEIIALLVFAITYWPMARY
ncbi:YwaF family protein [Robertmurraya sp. Marseille-Q9965]